MSKAANPGGPTELPTQQDLLLSRHDLLMTRILRAVGLAFLWFILVLLTLWAIAALYVDFRIAALRIPVTLAYLVTVVVILLKDKPRLWEASLFLAGFGIVLVWWLSLKPSNDRDWQADVARTAWTEIDGDRVTIHNLRNCDYTSESLYTNCWHDRTVYLSQIQGVDFVFTTWGVPWIGHPILSFVFEDGQHIAFSIEARYQVGESYSAIRGFFRQYELIFVVADERDVVRLRTNYRKGEEVYLYRTNMQPETARSMFLTYNAYVNKLRNQPEWYNALTKNCTTTLDRQLSAQVADPQPWSYELVVNGTLDQLLYNRGRFVTNGLSYGELKERAHINAAARAANQSPDFSALIRTQIIRE
jgi:hypothetical protein